MSHTAKHILFSGRVQGVGFRFAAHRIANRCGLAGYVRNTVEGKVEVFVQGHPDDIDTCIKDIEEVFSNYIKDTKIEQAPPNEKYETFNITF